ncbi:pupal cuticle protein-like [Arctopsyche grandis]|uniref:pupal cuticle protein-like n=1 Tax=Arctopsyche grandis TaxID=121162 RepID=UPI00406D7F2E
MNSMTVVFLLALAAGSLAAPSWNSGNGGSWAPAPAPANIALSQDGGNVLDTPEVAQARAAHLAAISQAAANAGNSNDDGSYDSRWEAESAYNANQAQWNSAPAQNQWNAAPAQPQWNAAPAQPQWNAAPAQPQWNAAPAQPQWNSAQSQKWQNTPANIALSQDGQHVLDTPEVAQARAAHLAAYSAAKAGAAAQAPAQQSWNAAPAQSWNAAPAQSWNAAPAPAAPAASSWNGAPSWQSAPAQKNWAASPSQISLSQNGQNVLDTPEVAQARAAHLAAHAAAASSHAPAAPARHW